MQSPASKRVSSLPKTGSSLSSGGSGAVKLSPSSKRTPARAKKMLSLGVKEKTRFFCKLIMNAAEVLLENFVWLVLVLAFCVGYAVVAVLLVLMDVVGPLVIFISHFCGAGGAPGNFGGA